MRIGSTLNLLVAASILLVLLAGCFGGVRATVSQTGVAFATPQTFAAGLAPSGLASADINGDGKTDVLVADTGGNAVAILLNYTVDLATITASATAETTTSPSGSPSPSPSPSPSASPSPAIVTLSSPIAYGAGSGPVSVASADIDSDGRADIIVGNSDGSLGVLLNTSATNTDSPTFSRVFLFTAGGHAQQLQVDSADINGDGRPDLLAADQIGNSVSIFLNTTVSSIEPKFIGPYTFPTGTGPRQVVVRDINTDGFLDVVTANTDGTVTVMLGSTVAVNVMLNPPAPTFAKTYTFSVGGGACEALVVADFDSDGRLDIAVGSGGGNAAMLRNTTSTTASPTPSPAATVVLTASNPSVDLSFDQPRLFGLNGTPAWFASGKFAVNGTNDLVAPIPSANNVSVLVNSSTNPTLSLEDGDRWDAGPGPVFALPLDIDGDGKTDIVVSNPQTNQVSVLVNVSTAAETAATSSPTVSTTSATSTR